jgi:hypothetical protein
MNHLINDKQLYYAMAPLNNGVFFILNFMALPTNLWEYAGTNDMIIKGFNDVLVHNVIEYLGSTKMGGYITVLSHMVYQTGWLCYLGSSDLAYPPLYWVIGCSRFLL